MDIKHIRECLETADKNLETVWMDLRRRELNKRENEMYVLIQDARIAVMSCISNHCKENGKEEKKGGQDESRL